MTFGNTRKNLWSNMLFFFHQAGRQSRQILKNHFFQKQKFEFGFLDLYIPRKLWIISF